MPANQSEAGRTALLFVALLLLNPPAELTLPILLVLLEERSHQLAAPNFITRSLSELMAPVYMIQAGFEAARITQKSPDYFPVNRRLSLLIHAP